MIKGIKKFMAYHECWGVKIIPLAGKKKSRRSGILNKIFYSINQILLLL
jgi:hypothetical protein